MESGIFICVIWISPPLSTTISVIPNDVICTHNWTRKLAVKTNLMVLQDLAYFIISSHLGNYCTIDILRLLKMSSIGKWERTRDLDVGFCSHKATIFNIRRAISATTEAAATIDMTFYRPSRQTANSLCACAAAVFIIITTIAEEEVENEFPEHEMALIASLPQVRSAAHVSSKVKHLVSKGRGSDKKTQEVAHISYHLYPTSFLLFSIVQHFVGLLSPLGKLSTSQSMNNNFGIVLLLWELDRRLMEQ